MNLDRQICEALCKGFIVRSVPIGFAIASPFDWFAGDKMIFYARTRGALVRFEDSGSTLFELEGAGVDLSSATRLDMLRELCREHGVTYDEEESSFFTQYVRAEEVGLSAIRFMSFLHRVQDLLFTVRTRISNTFRDDLIAAIEERFGGDAVVLTNEPPVPSLPYYIADVIVKNASGKVAAIFPATTEEKALIATLFAKEIELKHIENVVSFLIFEQMSTAKISRDTQARAMNSELQLATWEGGKIQVLDKIDRHVH